jgi:DNA-binding transcriptional LysR family regulator
METSWLETLCEVARRGSITLAASSLGYTQSAVSRQIATLESATGARLFDRHVRGVELTEAGRCLLSHADAILNRLDAARRDLESLGRVEIGRLRVGAFPTANAALIPMAMAEFAAKHPEVSLSLIEGTTRRQLANLALGDIDLAVVSAFPNQPLDSERFDFVHLLDDPLAVAFPCSHRLARRRSVRLRELSDERWVAGTSGGDSRSLSPLSLSSEIETRIEFQVGEWTAKLGLVAAGLGITLVPSLAATASRSDIALVPLHPAERAARSVYFATVKHRTPSTATDTFAAILATLVRTLRKRGLTHGRGF